METHPELSPWLSGVYVSLAWRGRGVGTALVRAATQRAASLGVRRLYLYTERAPQFYERLSWRELSRELYHGLPVIVMKCDSAM